MDTSELAVSISILLLCTVYYNGTEMTNMCTERAKLFIIVYIL